MSTTITHSMEKCFDALEAKLMNNTIDEISGELEIPRGSVQNCIRRATSLMKSDEFIENLITVNDLTITDIRDMGIAISGDTSLAQAMFELDDKDLFLIYQEFHISPDDVVLVIGDDATATEYATDDGPADDGPADDGPEPETLMIELEEPNMATPREPMPILDISQAKRIFEAGIEFSSREHAVNLKVQDLRRELEIALREQQELTELRDQILLTILGDIENGSSSIDNP